MSDESVESFLASIEARRRDDVVSVARSVARDRGFHSAIALLADVQREVGLRWQTTRWSVADEHAATAMVDLALAAVAVETQPESPRGSVVVVCAEEEWHVLPARMFAEQLRAAGWEAIFLGASTPAEHLSHYLGESDAVAVALSCSVAIHLPGARRTIEAVHRAGLPIVVGGPAFGTTSQRARALGADGWAADTHEASVLLDAWTENPPELAVPAVDDSDQVALAARRAEIVDSAMTALAERFPPVRRYTAAQLVRTREDFDYILRFVEAALLTDDESIVTAFAGWLSSVLTSRGLPPEVVPLSLEVLHGCVPDELSRARLLLDQAVDAIESP